MVWSCVREGEWFDYVFRRVLHFEVEGYRRKGRINMTWWINVEEESMKVGISMDDQSELLMLVRLPPGCGENIPPLVVEMKTDHPWLMR